MTTPRQRATNERNSDPQARQGDAYIALLRGINVGGRTSVAMSALRDLFAALGCADARTLLQSGNVVFHVDAQSSAALERLLEGEAEAHLGLRTDFFVRTAAEWEAVVARNPFPDEAERDPGHLVVMALKAAPDAVKMEALRSSISGPETIQADGRQLYVVYPEGIGRSKLTTTLIEAKLGTRGTGRNWNTVLKLAALVRH